MMAVQTGQRQEPEARQQCDWMREIAMAFEVCSAPTVKLASVHQMTGGGRAHGEMTALERHGQAALLLSYVMRRSDPVCWSYWQVIAGRDFGAAQPLMQAVLAALPTGAHSVRAVMMLVEKYCGRQHGIRAISIEAKCRKTSAFELRDHVYAALDAVHDRAVRAL